MQSERGQLDLDSDIQRLIGLLEKLKSSSQFADKEKIENSLQALKSDFFGSVRYVYENLYNSLSCSLSTTAKSNAASKATVAAFAAAYGHTHPRIVKICKGNEGFGFNVMGGKEQKSPILVSRIIPDGAAEKQGELKRGDQLLSVNGVNIENEFHEKAVSLLKNADEVCLVVRYMPGILKEMEEKFERSKRRSKETDISCQ